MKYWVRSGVGSFESRRRKLRKLRTRDPQPEEPDLPVFEDRQTFADDQEVLQLIHKTHGLLLYLLLGFIPHVLVVVRASSSRRPRLAVESVLNDAWCKVPVLESVDEMMEKLSRLLSPFA